MARRLDDPAVLATALVDRHLVPWSFTDLDARRIEAEELIVLGEQGRRTDLVLIGHEWLYRTRLAGRDLVGARDALDNHELLASLMPSPRWRYVAMIRRAMLSVLDGERSRALDLLERALPLGRRALPDVEAINVEHGVRTMTARLTGIADPALAAIHQEAVPSVGQLPVAFFQVHLAGSHLALGDEAAARRIVSTWASDPARTAAGPGGSSTVVLVADLVADLRLAQHAGTFRAALTPFADLYSVDSGFGVELPIDATLGRLALLEGDTAGGLRHLEYALTLARTMPSPLLDARCRWELARAQGAAGDTVRADQSRRDAQSLAAVLGIALPGDSANTALLALTPAAHATMRRSTGHWPIESPHGRAEIADTVAVDQLARLLAAAPRDVAAVELAGSIAAPVASDLGPLLDATAKRTYRRRIEELQNEIDNASGAERARVNVTRNLRRAIRTVSQELPALGAHLDVSIRTGRYCGYSPDPAAAPPGRSPARRGRSRHVRRAVDHDRPAPPGPRTFGSKAISLHRPQATRSNRTPDCPVGSGVGAHRP